MSESSKELLPMLWPILETAERDSMAVQNEFGGDNRPDRVRIERARSLLRQMMGTRPVHIEIFGANLGYYQTKFEAEWSDETGVLVPIEFVVAEGSVVAGYRVIEADGATQEYDEAQEVFSTWGRYAVLPHTMLRS